MVGTTLGPRGVNL